MLRRAILENWPGPSGELRTSVVLQTPAARFARCFYAGLGDTDSAFQWLEKAYEIRTARVHELPSMYFDGLRSDPRYADLLRRVGLPLQR